MARSGPTSLGRVDKRRSRRSRGFSLAELMIATAVGGALMAGAITLVIAHMRTASRMEALMRLQETWSRVQFLLDQEIREARLSDDSPSVEACSLTLAIPNPAGGDDASVVYGLTEEGTITRTGPPILDTTGQLDFDAATTTETVVRGVTEFCPELTNGRISYEMTLRDGNGVFYRNQNQPSGARGSSRVVDQRPDE